MVGLSAWLTYLYLVLIPGIVASVQINFITILIIVGPPVIGGIVTFFLFKPLLSRRPRPPEPMQLQRQDAEILFRFVEHVCAMIGAPPPKRIDVDLQVNASASLRRGWRSLVSNDLTLTIGLPLVAGLTARQFAGVLAHEFGHFTQKAGMRVYFLIGHVRFWFARVAHDRDRWDVWLDTNLKTSGWRARVVLRAAEWAVNLSRTILKGLLYAATWMSAWFSRQMEFDADRHEASLVGGDTSAEVSRRLPILSTVSQWAWNDVNESWRYGRLAENFPVLVQDHCARIAPETCEQILQSVMGEETGRWATHPATRDRIENVKGMEGALTEALDQPAPSLFPDFAALCQQTTSYHYKVILGDAGEQSTVVPSQEFLSEVGARRERAEAKQTVFSQIGMPSRWFVLPEGPGQKPETTLLAVADDSVQYWAILEQSLNRHAGREFLRAGGKIQPAGFHLSSGDLSDVEEEARASRESLQREIERLRKRYQGNGCMLTQDAVELRQAYGALSTEQPALLTLRYRWAAAGVLLRNLNCLNLSRAAVAREAALDGLRTLSKEIVGRLDAVPCPVVLPGMGPSSIGRQLVQGERPGILESMDAYELAQTILTHADDLAELLLGDLCVVSSKTWKKDESGAAAVQET